MQRILIALFAIVLHAGAVADEVHKKYQLVAPKNDGIVATDLNDRGELIGFEWVERPDQPGVISQVPFYSKGQNLIPLPLLPTYTATNPAAVSNTGLVVGYCSKPLSQRGRVFLSNQAFIWDKANGIRGLGALKDDLASFAFGVTSDGSRISGFSVGDNRVRACIWEQDGTTWQGKALPQAGKLGSQRVVMSDNGKYIASIDGSDPCLWSRGEGGIWSREVIGGAGTLAPRAVNNSGVVVGLNYTPDGLTHAVIWTRATGTKRIEEPKGFVRSEATAINNDGVVVGMVDGPGGHAIEPKAFVYEKGTLRFLDECGRDFVNATAINNVGQVSGVLDKEEAEEAREAKARQPVRPEPK
jgi:uncharacterized membrane protein